MCKVPEIVQMVLVDVQYNRNVRKKLKEVFPVLAGFGYQVGATAYLNIAAYLIKLPAYQ